jgi:hypothetical protein
MNSINQPLSNVQLELLKTFSYNLSDNELKELKALLADFFSRIAISEANKVWERDGWDDKKVKEILETKLRKTNKKYQSE